MGGQRKPGGLISQVCYALRMRAGFNPAATCFEPFLHQLSLSDSTKVVTSLLQSARSVYFSYQLLFVECRSDLSSKLMYAQRISLFLCNVC